MGADLNIAITKMEHTYQEALQVLNALDERSVYLVVNEWYYHDDDDYERALDKARECLKEVYDYYERGSRDTVTMNLDGNRWLISGGMSWGDDPTDAFRPLAVVDDLRVTYKDYE